jgi:hypothetical protein
MEMVSCVFLGRPAVVTLASMKATALVAVTIRRFTVLTHISVVNLEMVRYAVLMRNVAMMEHAACAVGD